MQDSHDDIAGKGAVLLTEAGDGANIQIWGNGS